MQVVLVPSTGWTSDCVCTSAFFATTSKLYWGNLNGLSVLRTHATALRQRGHGRKKSLALRRAWSSPGGTTPTTDLDGCAQARLDCSHRGHGAVNDLIGAGVDRKIPRVVAIARNCGTFMQLYMLPLSDMLNKFPFTFGFYLCPLMLMKP